MKERVSVPMLINEIKESKQGDILMFDGKRWIPATFASISAILEAKVDKVAEDTQNTLIAVSKKLDKVCSDESALAKAYSDNETQRKKAYAVSMAFNKIAIDEVIGDSECPDFGALKDWYNEYVKGSTDKLSDDKAFLAYFALFNK